MKRKQAGLYDPYLDVLGGGEKHILSILKALEDESVDISIFWNENLQNDFKIRLDLSFKYLITFLPNVFERKSLILKKIKTLKRFDYFFYVTDGSYFVSTAKQNFVFCMVPKQELYNMNLLNRLKTGNYKFITNSKFTQSWLKKWGIKSDVLYPYLGERFITTEVLPHQKKKIILSVGRFFKHLHSKKHDSLIETFRKLKSTSSEFKNYKLILAGAVKDEDTSYFEKLKDSVKGDSSIQLKPNILFEELFELYQQSSFFWHMAGLGVNEEKFPYRVEHLGITPLEAMATGSVVFCVNSGGPKELVKDGINGFLFSSTQDLIRKTVEIISKKDLQRKIRENAKRYAKKNFNYEVFQKRVKVIISDS